MESLHVQSDKAYQETQTHDTLHSTLYSLQSTALAALKSLHDTDDSQEVGEGRMRGVMEVEPGLAVYVVCLSYLVISYLSGDLVLGVGALIGLFVLKLWTS